MNKKKKQMITYGIIAGAALIGLAGLTSPKPEQGSQSLQAAANPEEPSDIQVKKSGAPVAGINVALDDYYAALDRKEVSRSVMEDLTTTVGLTQEETGYVSIMDVYTNLGVAKVSGYLNIRKEPKEDGEIVGKLTRNGGCEILGEEDGWYKIQSGPVTGYASKEFIVTGDEAKAIASEESSLVVKVDTDVLRVRTEPNTESRIWDQGYAGETYEVAEDLGDGWVKIHLEGNDGDTEGSDGYVYTNGNATLMYALPEATKFSPSELAAQAHSKARRDVVDYAMQFLGNPYVWGGTNPHTGADCSGFTQYVLRNGAGVSLNRTSREQAKQGQEITSAQLQPGDLIFYGNSRGSINHVSMYIGNGQVIHASSKKTGIKISQWNYRSPVAIRNMIGD